MNRDYDRHFDEVVESSSLNSDCGCDQERGCGCSDHGIDGCGCARKEYLGKSVTETRYYQVKTKRFIPSENTGCCGGCR